MRKFTKESLLSLIDDKKQADTVFDDRSRLKRDALRKNYVPKQISDLTCDPQESWSFCDDILDYILKLKSPMAQLKVARALLDQLRAPGCDHFSLRASGLIVKVIDSIVSAPLTGPNSESLLAEILSVIASDEANAPYFDEKSVDYVLRLLASPDPSVMGAGVRILSALGRHIPTEPARTRAIVANIECRGSAADVLKIVADALPASLGCFAPNSVAILADAGHFDLVVDAVHRQRELADAPAVWRALLNAFSVESEMWLAAVCNILELNPGFARELGTRGDIIDWLTQAVRESTGLCARYGALILGFLNTPHERELVSLPLDAWLRTESNPRIRACVESVLQNLHSNFRLNDN
jgi:hypothetical protein